MNLNLSNGRFFVQPGTEIASERHVSCRRLGQARWHLGEQLSPLTDPLLAKPESGTEPPFQHPVPKQPSHELFRLEAQLLEVRQGVVPERVVAVGAQPV